MDETKKNKMRCGSEFDLIKQHYTDTHLNHKEKLRENKPVKILCKTCEYFEDFWKNMSCFFNSLEKDYDIKMSNVGL